MKLAWQIKQHPRVIYCKSTIKQSFQLEAVTEAVYAIKRIRCAHQSNLGGPACIFVDKAEAHNAYVLCKVNTEVS